MSLLKLNFENNSVRTIMINNIVYFIASDVCSALELTNPSVVIKSIPEEDKISIDPKFHLGSKSNQFLWAVNESGLYFMIFKSKKENAKRFKKWVFQEVLPTIRKSGNYSIFQDNPIANHLNIIEQKSNSKLINADKFKFGGVESIKEYNRLNCLIHTGHSTEYIKQYGRKKGLKSKDYNSAKQVIRKLSPHTACAMSFADSILHSNPDKTLNDIKPITLASIKVFDEMIKIGIPIQGLDDKK